MKDFILNILKCPDCQNTRLISENDNLICHQYGNNFYIDNEKLFFLKTPKDIKVNKSNDSLDNQKWSNWRKVNYEFYKHHFKEIPKEVTVMDLGVGPGQFSDLTKEYKNLINVDFYPYDVVDVLCDINKIMPFKNESIDIIILSNVVEHIPDSLLLFSECFRILKPKGRIIGTIPFLMRIHQPPYDFNRYTNYQLINLLNLSGFVDVQVKCLGTSFNVYKAMQVHFFNYLFDYAFSKRGLNGFMIRLITHLIWKLYNIQNYFFQYLFKQAITTNDYTQGYGFIANKIK